MQQRAALAQFVEGAGFDEAFQHAAVERRQVDAAAEVLDRLESPARLPLGDKGLDHRNAHVFDGRKAEADALLLAVVDPLSMEKLAWEYLRWRGHLDAQAPGLVDRGGHLIGHAEKGLQERRSCTRPGSWP